MFQNIFVFIFLITKILLPWKLYIATIGYTLHVKALLKVQCQNAYVECLSDAMYIALKQHPQGGVSKPGICPLKH